MKKIYRKLICMTILVAIASSCTKDLKLSPVSVISASNFWKTENDATAGLAATYGLLRILNANQSQQYYTYCLGEARSDVLTAGTAGNLGLNIFYENTLNAINAGPSWSGYYSVINAANQVIKYSPGITFSSDAAKNTTLAEAYTMRAYTYFIMSKTWGDLVLRTDPLEKYDPADVQRERAPKADVFKLIKADIEKAISLFPNNNFPTGRNKWSKPAANALKAEVFMWTAKTMAGGTADLNTALAAINEVQTASNLNLLPVFADVFTNKGNNEVIMAIRLADGEGQTGYTNYMYGPTISPCTPQADKDLIGVTGSNTNHSWQLSPSARAAFSDDDSRKRATFVDIYAYNSSCQPVAYAATVTIKYHGTVINGVRQFYDDIILFRYADLLLMKAEVKNALGQDPSPEINQVRQRAYGATYPLHTFVNGTQAQNDDTILKERLLELVIEGKRWWDLVRFGKAFDLVPSLQSKKGQDYLLLFPISNATLALETKVKQNPGY